MPRKKLSPFEEQNNKELIKMLTHVEGSGFEASITVADNRRAVFEGIAKDVTLLIDSGIAFEFEEDLEAYEKLGLHPKYYLHEATMTFKSYTPSLKGLEITLKDSNITFYIKPI